MAQRKKSLKPCKSHQYRDRSNRCRNYKAPPKKRSSNRKSPRRTPPPQTPPLPPPPPRQSTKVSSKRIIPVGPGISDQFKKLSQDCSKQNKWKKGKLLGAGNYGNVYQVCRASNETECNYVMKSQPLNEDFYQEIHALQDLQSTDVVPKLYSAWVCGTNGFIVTELLKQCTDITPEEKYKQIKNALAKMKAKDWLHVDIHPGNIMCADDGKKVIMIDFGWAVKKGNEGDNTLYPTHPLVGRITDSGIPASWKQLDKIQDANLEFNFDSYGLYDEDAFLKALKGYYEVLNYSTSEINRILKLEKEAINSYKKILTQIGIRI